ncbi:ATP-binding protein [Actinomadura rayongensis]|uniref:Histidine kinase/HSP90-like ATPase domain-containing protein n=1 Tax=Actinomadura rayongensis TaxID=1429076 RepID=A0A6I4W336_9ACTN|nr:ATP-binding protein [Actinomadura rayongensis]MXQ65069.1 hypothetical protein [Actinomadura rayongensis]
MSATSAVLAVTGQFPTSTSAVGLAPDRVGNALVRWNCSELVADAILIVGELMANAIEVSGVLDRIKVHARVEGRKVILAVWDCDVALPCPQQVELSLETLDLSADNWDDNGGWGLTIVQSLSSAYWVERTPPRGKWVCAALACGRPR